MAAVGARLGRSVEGAADTDAAAVGGQIDFAAVLDHAPGLDEAEVVHHRGRQVAGHGRRHDDAAAVGQQLAGVGDTGQVGQGLFIDGEVDEPVALEVQGELVAGGQGDGAEPGLDDAGVGGVVAGQHHVAAVAGDDGAGVGDLGQGRRSGVPREDVIARQEILVADSQGGGHQAGHVDAGAGAEKHAVGVDQEDLAVGAHAAEDVGRRAAHHPVEDHGRAAGLDELDVVAAADGEALPVDDRAVDDLIDHHAVGGRVVDGGGGGAADHHAAGRQFGKGEAGQKARQEREYFPAWAETGETPGDRAGLEGSGLGSHDRSPERFNYQNVPVKFTHQRPSLRPSLA